MTTRLRYTCIGQIEIVSHISVSDTSYFYDEAIIVDVRPGQYQVDVAYSFPEGHQHVASVRVIRRECTEWHRGKKLGLLVVDFGQVGICDRDAVEKAFDGLGDTQMSRYYDQLNSTDLTLVVRLPGQIEMIVVRPGYGDGSYPIYGIVDGAGALVGVEISCIELSEG